MEHEERLKAALADRYAIEREIGSGGMATVYLARDLKHDRKVAVKVLKPELAAVLGAERFLSEIQTTAHLQHPNILPLFDSGEADGQLFYVMPYVEGESLRDRLNREKQLPVEEAVRIATEVAEALQAAHDEGVIHRDIKPANILLRKGKPLVADFGIALAVSAAGGGRLTETGLSLGTPFYMSPEQASADRDPDARSDVYSLGCVLYEMLTGEPPFPGSSAQAVLAKILAGEATPPTQHRKSIPPNVESALLKAIERLPADRFGSMAEMAAALADPAYRYGAEPAVAATRSSTVWKASTLATTLIALGLAVWAVQEGSTPSPEISQQRVVLFDWSVLDSADAVSGSVRFGVGISPDGKTLALRDLRADQLSLKEDQNLDPVPLAGTEGGFGPVFSPDGESIAFFSSVDNTLRKIPRVGGSPVTLAQQIATREQQIAWLDDGRIVFTALGWHLDAVSQEGGPVERLVDISETPRFINGVTALPGSPGVILSTCDNACPNPEVRVFDFRTGEMRTLISGATGAWYLRSGHVLFVRAEGTAFVAPFDVERLELTGPELPVLTSVATTPRRADLTASWDGTVVYLRGTGTEVGVGVEPTWVAFDGTGTPVQEGWAGVMFDPVLSPDERHLAYREGSGVEAEILVKELPDGAVTRLTNDEAMNRRPVWTWDGQSVVFETQVTTDGTTRSIFRARRADASTEATTFLDVGVSACQVEFSPDGRWILYRVGDTDSNQGDLFVLDLQGDSVGRPLLTGDYNEMAASFSPDGRWLAYVSAESGSNQVVVRPFPDVDAARHPVSVEGGKSPLWAPDGSAIYFQQPDARVTMVEARVVLEPEFMVVERRELFPTVGFRSSTTHWYHDLSSDGRRFLMLKTAGESVVEAESGPLGHVLVRNLLAEIQGR